MSDAWMTGRTARAADNRVMLVRARPPSFGMRRLEYQAGAYPDIAVFLQKFGTPDFLAEMTNKDRHYLIFYYLKPRKAFACRTKNSGEREVEFAGPYPISSREFQLLSGFREQAARVNRGLLPAVEYRRGRIFQSSHPRSLPSTAARRQTRVCIRPSSSARDLARGCDRSPPGCPNR
jgi:hypothetical protein